MGSAAAWLLLAATIVFSLAAAAGWYLLRRPARRIERQMRHQALSAAAHYTPAPRVPPYGPQPAPAPDPCAPGLDDAQRVAAMRTLLLQRPVQPGRSVAELLAEGDPGPSTSPMAWTPTLPPDEAEVIDLQRPPGRPRVRESDHEHVTLI